MKNISQVGVRRIKVTRPDLDEQGRIAARIDAVVQTISTLWSDLAKLRQQKHGLMHDLLTGRVRVKVNGG